MRRSVVAVLALAVVAGALWMNRSEAADELPEVISEVVIPARADIDLRNLPTVEPWQEGDPEYIRSSHYPGLLPEYTGDIDLRPNGPFFDPLRQAPGVGEGVSAAAIKFGVNLEAFTYNGVHPPDVVGDVGPNHYIAMINFSLFSIYDKQGNLLTGPTNLDSLWTAGGPCSAGTGDPIVLYDDLADRWMMSEFANTGNHLCMYISQGPNPVTDGWFLYDFSTPSFPDYPKYGVWPDAYYVTTFEGGDMGLYAMDRVAMLAGNPATSVRFGLDGLSPLPGNRFTRILPADMDGTTVPPGVSPPGIFMRSVEASQDSANQTDRLEIYEFAVDFVTPANSTMGLAQTLTPAAFATVPCSPSLRDCIVQSGSGVKLDALSNRMMRRLQYRNFGTHEMMLVNQAVDAGAGVSGLRWYELRRPITVEGVGSWSIFQSGTYSPDGDGRWMGSIAMNGAGEIGLGYSVAGSSTFPSIRVTGRLASDLPGTMPITEGEMATGTNPQTTTQRWGDYSSMTVDPTDDRTFWYIQEYMPTTRWRIQLGSFQIAQEIFIDGFESGDTSGWSSVTP